MIPSEKSVKQIDCMVATMPLMRINSFGMALKMHAMRAIHDSRSNLTMRRIEGISQIAAGAPA